MKSQPISACVCKAKIRYLGIRVRVGRSAPPAHTGLKRIWFNQFHQKFRFSINFIDIFVSVFNGQHQQTICPLQSCKSSISKNCENFLRKMCGNEVSRFSTFFMYAPWDLEIICYNPTLEWNLTFLHCWQKN